MAKYRKLPLVVDAVQWHPGSNIPGVSELEVIYCLETSMFQPRKQSKSAIDMDFSLGIVSPITLGGGEYIPLDKQNFKTKVGRIHTLEGPMYCQAGDWIITGVNGEKYSCKDEIFKKTYESADIPAIGNTSTEELMGK